MDCFFGVKSQEVILMFFFLSNRCAFVSNLTENAPVPSLVSTHKDLQAVLQRDLSMNVYRDGLWGAFRHQLLSQGQTENLLLLFHKLKVKCI